MANEDLLFQLPGHNCSCNCSCVLTLELQHYYRTRLDYEKNIFSLVYVIYLNSTKKLRQLFDKEIIRYMQGGPKIGTNFCTP